VAGGKKRTTNMEDDMLSNKLEGFIPFILQECESQFPTTCKSCGRGFADFLDYVRATRPIGLIPDMDPDDDPLGLLSLANCNCGNTLALKCESLEMHTRFIDALEKESAASGRSLADILVEIRSRIRAAALAEHAS